VPRSPELWRGRADRLTTDMLVELALDGSADEFQLEHHFAFEAPHLREAVELATELRELVRTGVQVRPRPLRPLARRRWVVVARTPAVPLLEAIPDYWRGRMVEAVERRPQCSIVSWEVVLRADHPDERWAPEARI